MCLIYIHLYSIYCRAAYGEILQLHVYFIKLASIYNRYDCTLYVHVYTHYIIVVQFDSYVFTEFYSYENFTNYN